MTESVCWWLQHIHCTTHLFGGGEEDGHGTMAESDGEKVWRWEEDGGV